LKYVMSLMVIHKHCTSQKSQYLFYEIVCSNMGSTSKGNWYPNLPLAPYVMTMNKFTFVGSCSTWVCFFWHKLKIQMLKNPKYNQPSWNVVHELKAPTSYSSSLKKWILLATKKWRASKNHDCHIILEYVLF
jgi:hypothetical protein